MSLDDLAFLKFRSIISIPYQTPIYLIKLNSKLRQTFNLSVKLITFRNIHIKT